MANDVTFEHRDYPEFQVRATLVDDVCENRVKAKKELYLPKPNPTDKSAENAARYTQYLSRAMFYNATGHTRRGLVGAAFRKPPELQTPATLNYVADDVDGEGNSIYQQSRQTTSCVVAKGRHGLLVDYPPNAGTLTVAEMEQNFIRASIVSIDALLIVNWRTTKIGGVHKISLLVYQDDQAEISEDGFGEKLVPQYRVLELIEGVYTVQLYRKNDKDEWMPYQAPIQPTRGNGSTWDEIPFTFVGSENNDTRVDMAPLYDLSVVNLGHYRNSADYEDSAYYVGQAQPWASGFDENHIELIKKEGIYSGSRSLMPVPPGEQYGIAQAEPNTMVHEAMLSKEKQMVALGARLMEQGSAVKTATQAQGELETEHSVLSLVVSNVSAAYTVCLEWMAVYMNTSGEALYKINDEFVRPNLDAQMLTAYLQMLLSGKWPEREFWSQMRKAGLMDSELTDEQVREELEATAPAGLELDDGE